MTSQGVILRTATIQKALGLATLGVSAAGVVAFGFPALDLDFPGRDTFVAMFTLHEELNVPTWLSSAMLLAAAALLAFIAAATAQVGGRHPRYWLGLAVLLLFASIDETASIHNRFGALSPLPQTGLAYYSWVVPAAAAVLAVGVAYIGFAVALPVPIRRLFVVAGTLYLGGALGLEMVGALVDEAWGQTALLYMALIDLEEILEIAGMFVFIVALLRHIDLRHRGAWLGLGAGDSASAAERAADPAPGAVE